MSDDHERTASLMTPAKLAQMKPKAAASPAAWLDQMAADAGHAHVRRLGELCEQLQSQARERGCAPVAAALQGVADSLPRLDFSLLQQNKGLFARFTGKGKTAGAEFNAQFDAVVTAAEAIKAQTQALGGRQQAQAAATERTLVEFEVEYRGIEKIIDQGARWLQDMRNQLKARQQAAAGDESALAQVRQDAARCEILVARLKLLRATSNAAQQAHQLAQAAAQRRAALVQLLQQSLAAELKGWQARMGPVAGAAGDSSSPALDLEGPMEAQRALQARLQQALADCEQLQTQERALADSLSQLGQELAAVAPT
jgi:hypothetical protein